MFRHHVVSQKHRYLELRVVVAAAVKSEVNEECGLIVRFAGNYGLAGNIGTAERMDPDRSSGRVVPSGNRTIERLWAKDTMRLV